MFMQKRGESSILIYKLVLRSDIDSVEESLTNYIPYCLDSARFYVLLNNHTNNTYSVSWTSKISTTIGLF